MRLTVLGAGAMNSPRYRPAGLLLVWGEQDGWLLALDPAHGEDPIVLAYLGQDVLPEPGAVQRFVNGMVAGHNPGQLQPPGFRRAGDHDDLPDRLAAYRTPMP